MRKPKNRLLFFLIGSIVTWFLLRQCSSPVPTTFKYVTGDLVPYAVFKGVPTPYAVYHTDTIPPYDTVWQAGDTQYVLMPIDTMAILRDYYSKVKYIDTVKNDSSALIVLNETIFKNRISNREVIFQNRVRTAIIEERTKAIVLGIGGTVNGLDASIGYRQDRNIFNLTYSSLGFGVRYQREIGWNKSSEK